MSDKEKIKNELLRKINVFESSLKSCKDPNVDKTMHLYIGFCNEMIDFINKL